MDAVGQDVAAVAERTSPQDSTSVSRLVGSWAKLVGFLALGPAPELRACPHCGAMGMRDATLCGYCWKKLVPPARRAEGAAA
ncbi:MAG TPA: hypothetical protein VF841_16910 [Anaeromyxobacter sp.]